MREIDRANCALGTILVERVLTKSKQSGPRAGKDLADVIDILAPGKSDITGQPSVVLNSQLTYHRVIDTPAIVAALEYIATAAIDVARSKADGIRIRARLQ